MEKLVQRCFTVQTALNFLKTAIDDYKSLEDKRYVKHLRNSKIQSFEFCVDTLHKFLKLYFKKVSGSNIEPSPKPVFRYCLKAKITSEEETRKLLLMVDDRNMSSHTYHEPLAAKLNNKIEDYYKLMVAILDRVKENLPPQKTIV